MRQIKTKNKHIAGFLYFMFCCVIGSANNVLEDEDLEKRLKDEVTKKLETRITDLSDETGWYFTNKGGFKYNYLGASYTSQFYYKNALFRDKNPLFFGSSEVNAGLEATFTSYGRLGAFVDFQPFSFFGIVFNVTYEGAWSNLGKPVFIESQNDYAHAVTGGPKSVNEIIRTGGNTLLFQITPYITLGLPIKEDFLVFVYRPFITIYRAFGVKPDTFLYYSTDNVVVKPTDVHVAHDVMLLYSITNVGVRFGIDGVIEQIGSYDGIWRYGIFAIGIYHKPLKNHKKFTPFAALKLGTWLTDRYFQHDFTIFAEFGLRWKVF